MLRVGKIERVLFNNGDFYLLKLAISKHESLCIKYFGTEPPKALKTVEYKVKLDDKKDSYGRHTATHFEKLKKKTTFTQRPKRKGAA